MYKIILVCCVALFLSACARKPIEKPTQRVAKPVAYTPKPQLIALDPGHGGTNEGAKLIIAPYTSEKIFTLKTAEKVEDFLVKWGYKVFMTRRSDVFIPLEERVELARKKRCTLFVSIHYNSTPKETLARGVEIYFYEKPRDARALHSKALAKSIFKRFSQVTQTSSRGVRPGNFSVIRETQVPAVLVEVAFLSNPEDAEELKKDSYLTSSAWAIAKGIDDYVRHKNK